jgi:hypothetical protein
MHACVCLPEVFYKKTELLQSELATVFEPWRDQVNSAHRPLWLYYVNLTVAGYLGAVKMDWLTDHITARLHEHAETSMCIIIQTNRSSDEGVKKEDDNDAQTDDDEEPSSKVPRRGAAWTGCNRMGTFNAVRLNKQKITDIFCEAGRDLQVTTPTLTFDPATVWGARTEFHDMILLTANNNKNVWQRGRLWRRQVCSLVPMLPRRSMVKPVKVKEGVFTVDTELTLVQRWKQAACMLVA